jgi:GDPmannose 4,6-dehydratase
MRKALIIGSAGQDGRLLRKLLEQKKYEVWGLGRSQPKDPQYDIQFDLAYDDFGTLADFIRSKKPDEIYYVAAFHHSSQEVLQSKDNLIARSVAVNQLAFIELLEICRRYHPMAKVIYTSSSLIFAGCGIPVQSEFTPTEPRCIYSVTKCAAMDAAKYYKGTHHLYVSVAIMYNHESKLRKETFLSKIIVDETRRLVNGEIDQIAIGDLSAVTDWGYAPDYVQAMWHILQLQSPDTFIVSTGIGHKVQDWFDVLFQHLDLDWRDSVVEDKTIVSRKKPVLIGDNSKLLNTGWSPETSFEDMVIRIYNDVL